MDEKQTYTERQKQLALIAKATVSQHLAELKNAGLIQGTIETPKVRYCINPDGWQLARKLFADFFAQPLKKQGCGCFDE